MHVDKFIACVYTTLLVIANYKHKGKNNYAYTLMYTRACR